MTKKIRVGVLCGGRSTEHEISLLSAMNVVHGLSPEKYDVAIIGITKEGKWFLQDPKQFLQDSAQTTTIHLADAEEQLAFSPESKGALLSSSKDITPPQVDVAFPLLHGPLGEDGTVQGMLRLLDVPFVGCDVLSSAIGLDKEITKRLLQAAGIPVTKFRVVHAWETPPDYSAVTQELGTPLFVKSVNSGSSVGVYKVKSEKEFHDALVRAFQFDTKVLIEEAIVGREIECGVLGNEDPKASLPGEIRVHDEFYSYEAKYVDEKGAEMVVPADLLPDVQKKIQETAVKVFQILECSGLARVDFFLTQENTFFVNEINTMPGFTRDYSMYPRLWQASGISYETLIDRLIALAFERYEARQKLQFSYQPKKH